MSGIEFESMRLRGMPFFKDSTFNFKQKGVSLILGRNLDSSNNNTNAAGKSLFFSQLPELIIGEPTIGNRKDLIRRGSQEWVFRANNHHYKVTRSFRPGEKITIERDGKDLEYRELSVAREAIRKLIPMSPEEVLSMLYLDSRIPHPLVRGDSSARKNFFKKFFHMHAVPTMRKVVKAEIDALASKAGEFKAYQERAKTLKALLEGRDLEAMRSKADKIKRRISTVEETARRYSKAERVKQDYLDVKADVKKLKAAGVSSLKEARAVMEAAEDEQSTIAGLLADWVRYDEYLETKQGSKERRAELVKEIGELGFNENVSIKFLTKRLDTFEANIEDYEKQLQSLKSKLKECSEDEIEAKQEKLVRARSLKKELDEATDKCPTCGSAYDNKHAKKELQTVKERISELKAAIEEAQSSREALLEKQVPLETNLEAAEKERSLLRKVRKLRTELDGLGDLEVVKAPKKSREDLKARRAELREQAEVLSAAKQVFAAVDAYAELSEEDLQLLKGESPTERLLTLHEEHSALRVQIEEVTNLRTEEKELKGKLSVLKEALDDKQALDILQEAFSAKGMEPQMIKAICERLEQKVNEYARLLFPEDVHFNFDLETQFNITVTRNYRGKKEPSDVRKLSGAESLLFSLILLLSLLAFVPAKHRFNLLVLDEPTANFSPEMIDAFVKFLPILNSVIPHIVVITPLPNNAYSGARTYTVVKKNGEANIIEGTDVSAFLKRGTTKKRKGAA